jgi:fatty acid desaturase
MTPREDRRFRIVRVVAPVVGGVMGWISSANDWSVGWIFLTIGVIFAAAVLYVHHEPRAPSRSRR